MSNKTFQNMPRAAATMKKIRFYVTAQVFYGLSEGKPGFPQ
jgi:hypothetical protein